MKRKISFLILLIGISRIYLGVHFASDVLAGFVLSIAYLICYITITFKLIKLKKTKKLVKGTHDLANGTKDLTNGTGLLVEKSNVVSNGIVPVVMALFGNYAGFIGAIATATADTMASEIGVLSKPILITSREHVKPGTDGGISALGTAAGLIGALIIGLTAYLVNVSPELTHSLLIALFAGMIGCFADSLLGATLERSGLFNNEHVNLSATIIGALVGIIIITIGA